VPIARILSALAGGAARRPVAVVALAAVLGLGGAALALKLRPSAATGTFVDSSSAGYRATQRFYKTFGEEPVQVVVQGSLQQLLLSSDIDRLVGLEGCLSGNVPAAGLAREGGANGPCAQIGRLGTVKAAIGPGTFVNEAATQIDEQLSVEGRQAETQARQAQRAVSRAALAQGHGAAEAALLGKEASKVTLERYAQQIELLGAEYGISAPPSLNDPSFVYTLVFDNAAKVAGTPKQRFAYLFPSREAALISVRLKAGLDERRRTQTIALIRRAVAMPQWRLQHGERYLVTGEPVIVSDLNGSITRSIELLLVAVLAVMAVTLSLIFRGRPRLLPLATAVLATALTFGALSAVGASLTVAQVAVLPVLVGLAVDYAIQFQSRVQEARAGGARTTPEAVRHAAVVGGTTIATAAAAAAGALFVLMLSPVPTVRGFGALLIVGVAFAFLCAVTVGSAALVLAWRRGEPGAMTAAASAAGSPRRGNPPPARGALARWLAPSWRGAQELLRDNPLTRAVSNVALVHTLRHPGRVLGVGLALAALGWGLDTQTQVETNILKLVPQNMASLRNLDALERASGVGGTIDLMVSGRQLATPATIEWMSSYENAVLKRFGYSSTSGCGSAPVCPAFSLPDLFKAQSPTASLGGGGSTAGGATAGSGAAGSGAAGSGAGATGSGAAKTSGSAGSAGSGTAKLTSAEVSGLLAEIPRYLSQEVISNDRRTATLAFGIKLMPLDEQQHVIETLRSALHPPRGVSATLVGLSVLAAQSGAQVASPWRRVLTLLAGLVAAALVLLIAFRGDRRRALVPLVPVVLATGWSALVLFAIRVPLNPMSVTLGTLVIAISIEFSVLLSERHRQECVAGHSVSEALRRAYRRTGAAVAASGVTAIMGFGVLVLSDISMLRDFGLVTLVDLSVSLVGVLVALPAVLVLADLRSVAAVDEDRSRPPAPGEPAPQPSPPGLGARGAGARAGRHAPAS
jgi:uncharacterized protein